MTNRFSFTTHLVRKHNTNSMLWQPLVVKKIAYKYKECLLILNKLSPRF